MNYATLVKELTFDEGDTSRPYLCPKGKWTIGKGHNLSDRGLTPAQREYLNYPLSNQAKNFSNLRISKEQSLRLFKDDIDVCLIDLRKIFKDFDSYSDELQHILINLEYQLGYDRFCGFYDMIRAIKRKDFIDAAAELRDSKLYRKDTPEDAERLAVRFEKLAKAKK